ncbi:MAG TPA: ubiquitin-like small modifier protein 1 [Segeticoccus sp.]|uniref:ubiquitin-like small modifier protein 1 n=1 Tax=Segeticoccus sp. TaxID=2706531 RepID=UPI002D7E2992|nr:ubiquitin-like small modifier protein 1 [Segeticoccus sp.]HET8601458.1 ubiquitin-like small modifier protein 1 [Segeticoccus sp.]
MTVSRPVATGTVRVVLPGVLRELADGAAELTVPLGGGSLTVRQCLDAVAADRPELGRRLRDETGALRRHVNVFVDGADIRSRDGLDTPLQPGAVVHVLPSVAGG